MFKSFFSLSVAVAVLTCSPVLAQCPHATQQQAAEQVSQTVPVQMVSAIVMPEGKDIVTTAVEAGSFKTLAAALGAADLVGALQGEGPFTVFAPTDDAFAALPAGTIETLLKPESKEKLQAILKYHVVSGKIMAGDVLKAAEVETLQGSKAPVGLTIGGANIVKTDIVCSNGVIHVIDAVLLPPSE
jgi:uncharacterized surface protein with fasciclin (FAS1) repeats